MAEDLGERVGSVPEVEHGSHGFDHPVEWVDQGASAVTDGVEGACQHGGGRGRRPEQEVHDPVQSVEERAGQHLRHGRQERHEHRQLVDEGCQPLGYRPDQWCDRRAEGAAHGEKRLGDRDDDLVRQGGHLCRQVTDHGEQGGSDTVGDEVGHRLKRLDQPLLEPVEEVLHLGFGDVVHHDGECRQATGCTYGGRSQAEERYACADGSGDDSGERRGEGDEPAYATRRRSEPLEPGQVMNSRSGRVGRQRQPVQGRRRPVDVDVYFLLVDYLGDGADGSQFSDSFGCPVDLDLHVGGHAVEVLEHGEQFKDLGLADDVVHAHLGVVHLGCQFVESDPEPVEQGVGLHGVGRHADVLDALGQFFDLAFEALQVLVRGWCLGGFQSGLDDAAVDGVELRLVTFQCESADVVVGAEGDLGGEAP